MEMTEIVIALIGLIGIVLPSYWGYLEKTKNREKTYKISQLEDELNQLKEESLESTLRTEVVERLLDITLLGEIREAVSLMFQETSATRFLILIAVNGKVDFNTVSVIFEQHAIDNHISAVARYRNLTIDDDYKRMLKKVERIGVVNMETAKMPEESLLRNIYEHEGVKHVKIRHLMREQLDGDNDVIIFSSVATMEDEPFTLREKAVFLTQYDSTIIPALREMINA